MDGTAADEEALALFDCPLWRLFCFLCLAGEATRPWHLPNEPEEDKERLLRGWTEIARYVREIVRITIR